MDSFIGFLLIIVFYLSILLIKNLKDWIYKFKKDLSEVKNLSNNKIELNNKEKQLNHQQQLLNEKEIYLQNLSLDIHKIANDNSQTSPWLAERYSDYFMTIDSNIENHLKYKKNPAIKASEIVSEIKKEKKELLLKNKMLEYQLSFLMSEFPMLENAMQLNVDELHDTIESINFSKEEKSDYDIISKFITPEEYHSLSTSDKYQLALDRYLSRPKKSLWEIGISYERYIGYIYETKKYKVTYFGALKGLEDLGRDVIAENDSEILIVQCKYWRKERILHENAIFQLYGTMILKQLETKKTVKGIIVTTTSLSEEAKKIAQYLNIQYRENEKFDKTYPCIKCNINRITGEKIYHFPFDQQYDRIQIEPNKGERYVSTVKEAEDNGFRRAMKHNYN